MCRRAVVRRAVVLPTRSGGLSGCERDGDVPGQQVVDPVDRVVGDVREHVPQVDQRVQAAHFGRTNEAI